MERLAKFGLNIKPEKGSRASCREFWVTQIWFAFLILVAFKFVDVARGYKSSPDQPVTSWVLDNIGLLPIQVAFGVIAIVWLVFIAYAMGGYFYLLARRGHDFGIGENLSAVIIFFIAATLLFTTSDQNLDIVKTWNMPSTIVTGIYLIIFSLPSQPGPNKYGPNPHEVSP